MKAPKGTLIIIGGKEYKGNNGELDMERLNKDFVEYEILMKVIPSKKQHKNKTIEVITTASEDPKEVIKDYKKAFTKLGHTKVDFMNIENRIQAQEMEYVERIKKAYSVYFLFSALFKYAFVTLDFPMIDLQIGCPAGIFTYVSEKKEK